MAGTSAYPLIRPAATSLPPFPACGLSPRLDQPWSGPKKGQHFLHVRREVRRPMDGLARPRVVEAKLCGVEHEPRRRHERVAVGTDVDAVAEDWMTGLGEVDPD